MNLLFQCFNEEKTKELHCLQPKQTDKEITNGKEKVAYHPILHPFYSLLDRYDHSQRICPILCFSQHVRNDAWLQWRNAIWN